MARTRDTSADMPLPHSGVAAAREDGGSLDAQALLDGHPAPPPGDRTELRLRDEALSRAKAEVEQTRAIMQTVLDNMSEAVCLYDKDHVLRFFNHMFLVMHELGPDQARVGMTIEDVLRLLAQRDEFGSEVDIETKVRERAALLTRTGGNSYDRRHKSGRHVEYTITPLADGGFVTVCRDITALKDREDAIARAKEEVERTRTIMQTILDNMNDGVSLFDKDFVWQFTNLNHIQRHEYPPDLLRPGVTGWDRIRYQVKRGEFGPVREEDVERRVEEITALMRQPGGGSYERRTVTGRYVHFTYKTLDDGSLLGVYRDITEMREREEALATAKEIADQARTEAEAANSAKSTFLATMSHEIRTPMNGVLGMIEVLERQGLSGEQQRTVATMRDSAQALLRIIDDVLDFSKIEAGKLDLEETAFSLSVLIEQVRQTFLPLADGKDLSLTSEIDPGSHDALIGDPTRVRQILFNLLGNALKFTERGGIVLRANTTPLGGDRARVSLVVEDTGVGLDEEQRTRLFRPFSQADSSTTRRFGGTGLGLSIVYRLAETMGGSVAVESEPGRGSVFTVHLTLRAAPADSPLLGLARPWTAVTFTRHVSGDEAAGRKVLVVDDHPVNREVLIRQLAILGVDSDSAVDGADALARWNDGDYALILADIHMPEIDGYELTRRIRAAERERGSPRMPIVAVTANVMKGEEQRCLALGMDAYVSKPISIERLKSTLQRWLTIRTDEADDGASASDTPSALDRSVLHSWLGDQPAAIRSLLGKFRDTAIEAEHELGHASRKGDLAALAAAAHKLKGAAQAVGAIAVGERAEALEQAGKAGDWSICRGALGPLATEIRRVVAEIDADPLGF